MNDFKKYFSTIINDVNDSDDKLKFKLSDHLELSTKKSNIIQESENIDLDLDLLENFDLDIEDVEEIQHEQKVEQLFDGYLGEKNFDPNPLEYGPNAMYRKNGVVYRKSVDNLWEAYLKDGSPGPRGSAGGSGVGVQEVQRLANDITNSKIIYDRNYNMPSKGNVSWNSFDLFYKDGGTPNFSNILNEYTISAVQYMKECGSEIVRYVYPAFHASQMLASVFSNGVPDREFVDSDFKQTFLNASDSWFDYLDSQNIKSHLTLFWSLEQNVHMVGLTSADYGTEFRSTDTKTVRYMKNFARWVVNRYKDRKNIVYYTIGNEYAWDELLETATYFTMEQMTNIFNEINSIIKGINKNAKVTADLLGTIGDVAYTRKTAQWYIDSFDYIYKNLDAWSLHFYSNFNYIGINVNDGAFFKPSSANNFGYETFESTLTIFRDYTNSIGKHFIIGETGVDRTEELDTSKLKKQRIINAIKNNSDYGMLWNLQRNDPPVFSNQVNWWVFPGSSAVNNRAETFKNIMKITNKKDQNITNYKSSFSDSLLQQYYPSYEMKFDRVANGRISLSSTSQMQTSGDYGVMLWLKINSPLNAFEKISDMRGTYTSGGFNILGATSGGNSWYILSKNLSGFDIGSVAGITPTLEYDKWYHITYLYKNTNSPYFNLLINGLNWHCKTTTTMGFIPENTLVSIGGYASNTSGCPVSIQDYTIVNNITPEIILKHISGEYIPDALLQVRANSSGKITDISRYNVVLNVGANVLVVQNK